ncbi:clavesin-2-like isoform X5 [Varroa jacobsoni]|uniref:CRAL-TRIO domain-containing protein n=1 Tax=Varroa destructor TaxID=109461 RepID=A0A7M7M6W6_VARDE|nr:clavesin-2-like isoform X3 [Varroa destructor]XP_022689573.1 clavesin-2-like isoform X5 [Varroa jacobsoni]
MKGHATLPLLFPVTQQRGLCHGRRHAHRDPKKVFIARVGHWNADSGFTLKDTYVPDIFLLEQALDDDESQVRGLVAIVDMAGFSFWHMRQLSFSHIKGYVGRRPLLQRRRTLLGRMQTDGRPRHRPDLMTMMVLVHTVQDAFPARFKAIHVVNQPGLYDYIYACIRPFLKPKIMKRIHLHGSDMTSLHEHIDPEILPEEYGGQAGPFNNDWICQQLYQRDEEFRKYSHYGFPRNEK